MVATYLSTEVKTNRLSVLALSSRFDGPLVECIEQELLLPLSVLALSSRFDGQIRAEPVAALYEPFSTRSVESF